MNRNLHFTFIGTLKFKQRCSTTVVQSLPLLPLIPYTYALAPDLRSASAPWRPLKLSPRGPAVMATSLWLAFHPTGCTLAPSAASLDLPRRCLSQVVRNVPGFLPPKNGYSWKKKKDLFLGVNCQPILAHPVPLLPLAQLERLYCFLAHNSKGIGHRQGTQRRDPRTALSEWKQDDFCSKQFPQHPPFPPTRTPC